LHASRTISRAQITEYSQCNLLSQDALPYLVPQGSNRYKIDFDVGDFVQSVLQEMDLGRVEVSSNFARENRQRVEFPEEGMNFGSKDPRFKPIFSGTAE
jgi:hypothetical protein